MDGPLSSSRHGDGGDQHYPQRGGSGGGGNRFNNYRNNYNNYNNYNNRRNTSHRSNHHHHHHRNRGHNRGGGGGGGGGGGYNHHNRGRNRYHPNNSQRHRQNGGNHRSSGNRFPTSNEAAIDPEKAMLKQLSTMVATMGDWTSASSSTMKDETADEGFILDYGNKNDTKEQIIQQQMEKQKVLRQKIIQTISTNVTDLSSVLTNPKMAPQFLKYHFINDTDSKDVNMTEHDTQNTTNTNPDEEKKAGPLATLLIACVYALPLQTPSYAALTLAIEKGVRQHVQQLQQQETNDEQPTSNFSIYEGFAKRCLQMASSRLHVDLSHMLMLSSTNNNATSSIGNTNGSNTYPLCDAAESFRRCKYILRYLAIMVKANLLQATYDNANDMSDADSDSKNYINMGMIDLLKYLIEKQKEYNEKPEAAMLSYLVLSTIPYLLDAPSIEKHQLKSLLDATTNDSQYQSHYKPGIGVLSILLNGEPQDENGEEEDSDDDDDDDDNDNENEPCCDSLQELLKANHSLLDNPDDALLGALTDAPWSNSNPSDSNLDESNENQFNDISPLVFSFVPIPHPDSFTDTSNLSLFPRPHHPLSSIILGRLPLYPPPPSGDVDDDDEDEDDNNMQNKPQSPYITNFSVSARTLLHDCIRDILQCHHPTISTSGLERGSCNSVAQQIWSLHHLFAPHSIHGMEFGIVECMLSLLAQSHQLVHTTTKSAMNLTRIYLARVLLELTNLYPTKIPQALAISVALLVENILPSLVPQSAFALADWLAFHLVNTDFQWPKEYWKYWAEEENLKGCKKEFFSRVLEVMGSLAGKKVVIEKCLPPDSPLLDLLIKVPGSNDINVQDLNTSDSLEKELRDRMWMEMEISTKLDDWMTEYDDSFEEAKNRDGQFWRAKLVTRALLSPPSLQIIEDDEDITKMNEDAIPDEEDGIKDKDDPLQDLLAGIKRYAPLVKSSISRGVEKLEDKSDEGSQDLGEAAVLAQIRKTLDNYSAITSYTIEAVYEAALEHKIVTPLGFVKFTLSKSSAKSYISSSWYYEVCLSTKYSITSTITSITDGVSMIIDSDDTTVRITNTVKQVTEYLSPLLEYICKRVSSLLLTAFAQSSRAVKKKTMTREMIILLEGLKQSLWEAQVHCCKSLKKYFEDGPGKMLIGDGGLDENYRNTVKEILQSAIGGNRLMMECKKAYQSNDGDIELDPDFKVSNLENLIFPWMEKLIVE